MEGEKMKKTEVNEIIKERILGLKDTEQMKAFLLEIIESELRNLNMPKARYTRDFMDAAARLSTIERGG